MLAKTQNKSVVFALFGATGDLAIKKIFPALEKMHSEGVLSKDSRIVAISRRDWQDSDFHTFLKKEKAATQKEFLKLVSYSKIDIVTGDGYGELKEKLEKNQKGELVVYLSLAPQHHPLALASLKKSGILKKGRGKILIEKPFGTDMKTACELDKLLASFLSEDQICRVDHYLGKDTIQAIMDLHESTPDFMNLIDKSGVESVRVRLFEEKGIEGRGETYDRVGAFRDVGQNHMLEMLAVVTADPSQKNGWQKARADILEHLAPPAKTCDLSRRAQYDDYGTEAGVKSGSETETAFEVITNMSSGRLQGVPLILEAGKKMGLSEVFIEINFKEISGLPKRMVFRVQPTQEISIENRDGTNDVFEIPKSGDAYENVILAALSGDSKTFVGREEIEALWSYSDRVVACWSKVPLELYNDKKPFLLK